LRFRVAPSARHDAGFRFGKLTVAFEFCSADSRFGLCPDLISKLNYGDDVAKSRVKVVADGSIVVSPPMWIDANVIRRVSVSIATRPVQLIFPVASSKSGNSRPIIDLLEPKYLGKDIPQVKVPPKFGWGHHDVKSNRLLVDALRFTTPMNGQSTVRTNFITTPQPLDWLRSEWPSWYAIVHDWLCAWTDLTRGQEHFVGSYDSIDAAAERIAMGTTGFVSGGIKVVGYGPVRAATADEVRAAFRCANNSYKVPVPWDFLMRANTARLHQQHRECVIDACTAVEASISNRIQKDLLIALVSAEGAKRITLQANGVVELYKLAISIGLTMPLSQNKVRARLSEPRNNAVHLGISPTLEEALAATSIANQIVKAMDPLPSPASLLRREFN